MGAAVMVLGLTGTLPAVEQAERERARAVFGRMWAAAAQPRGTAEERAAYEAGMAEVRALQVFLGKCRTVIEIGRWDSQFHQNYLTVQRDLVTALAALAGSPEEVLCWQRVGLADATADHLFTAQRVLAGLDPPQLLDQTRAQIEYFRKGYRRALEKCVLPPN
jgi:hypothetical protein